MIERNFQIRTHFFLKLQQYKVIMYDRIVTHFAIAVVAFTQMSYNAFFYCQGKRGRGESETFRTAVLVFLELHVFTGPHAKSNTVLSVKLSDAADKGGNSRYMSSGIPIPIYY